MADNARIEDLRKRYHENPRRFFAPLANEYRKAGFLDRAILLCEKHLGEQPGNLNGLVVYGQTLHEGGRAAEARLPFERALELDAENLIALRHLGDIARLLGERAEARKWYERVLELDRRNDEIQALLDELGDAAPAEGAAAVTAVSPAGDPLDVEPPSAVLDASSIVSVTNSVRVTRGDAPVGMGMIDLDAPAPPPAPKAPAGPGKTAVIDAQALADRDHAEADASAAATIKTPAVRPPEPAAPRARASLLDIDFAFDDPGSASASGAAPAAPTAYDGLLDIGALDTAGDATIEELPSAPSPDATDSLIVESASDGEPFAETPSGMDGLELAEFSSDTAPLAGLETTEFEGGSAEPLSGLDLPMEVGVPTEPEAPLAMAAPTEAEEPAALAEPAKRPSTELEELPDLDEPPSLSERTSGPRPRMTKASMASLPLIADYGLEDEPAGSPPDAAGAAPVAAEPAAATRESRRSPTIVTETMATLYLQQGHRREAMDVYRQLLQQSPDDAELRAKLAALEAEEMPDFEEPSADAPPPEPAPANAALADVSFGDVGLRTPMPAKGVQIPAAVGPSAREFFGMFARRAVGAVEGSAAGTEQMSAPDADVAPASVSHSEPTEAAASSTPVANTGWPFDALLGEPTDAADEVAGQVLASVGTFEGPSGGTGLDGLFDAAAAAAADSGVAAAPPGAPRKSVPRASQSLKFDQFFSPTAPTAPTGDAGASQEPPGDDDLGQFQDWLHGLKP